MKSFEFIEHTGFINKHDKHSSSFNYSSTSLLSIVAFLSLQDTDCLYGNNLFSTGGEVATDHKPCKKWCESRNDCLGFTVDGYNTCFFKESRCKDKAYSCPGVTLYLKTTENTGIDLRFFMLIEKQGTDN